MRGIVGLSMAVERVEAAQKMSQNRNDEHFLSIVETLSASHAPGDQTVAKVMKEVRPQLFAE